METKCDQPQIAALSNALQVGIKTEYLDASAAAGEDLQIQTRVVYFSQRLLQYLQY